MKKLLTYIVAGLLILSGQMPAPPKTPQEAARLESFYYSYGGMVMAQFSGMDARNTENGWTATFFLGMRDDAEDIALTDADIQTLEKLVTDYDLLSWSGFRESDRNVLDGEGFSFSLSFSDGTKVSASGSNAFPKGYFAAKDAILSAIEEMLIAHDIQYSYE